MQSFVIDFSPFSSSSSSSSSSSLSLTEKFAVIDQRQVKLQAVKERYPLVPLTCRVCACNHSHTNKLDH